MSNFDSSEKSSRLEEWRERDITGDHADLISAVMILIARYSTQDTDRDSVEIAEGIYNICLATLESGDAKQASLMKNWFTWLNGQSMPDVIPPTKVELPMDFVISRIEEEIKPSNPISYHPSDILKGRPGIDARVITRGSNNTWNVSKECKVTRVFGAKFTGGIPKSGPPIFAGVHLNNRGDRFNVQGEMVDYAGAQIGVRKGFAKDVNEDLEDEESELAQMPSLRSDRSSIESNISRSPSSLRARLSHLKIWANE